MVQVSGIRSPPRAHATLFNVTEKDGASCPAAALFETGTHCLTAISPVTDYCLAGVARFGAPTVTALGRERYKAGSTAPAEMLAAYERIGACPVATTSFENDRFCIVVLLW
jgi:hypothetical protein